MTSLRTEVNPLAFPLSVVAGILVAMCISVLARLETGYPPGVPPRPFARMLDRPAPSFEIEGLDGLRVSTQMVSGGEWLLFFTNSGCGACDAAYPALRKATRQLPAIVVGMGDRQVLREKLTQHDIESVVAHDSLQTVQRLYGVHSYPSVLLIDAHGVVRQGAVGSRAIEQAMAARDHDK